MESDETEREMEIETPRAEVLFPDCRLQIHTISGTPFMHCTVHNRMYVFQYNGPPPGRSRIYQILV